MQEKEPHYIKKLREHIDHKIETHEPEYFKDFKKHVDRRFDEVDQKIEREVGGLAAMTANEFRRIDARFEEIESTMATKEDIKNMATKQDIEEIRKDMATKEDIKDMATKHDVKEILAHIGRYEIRAQNVEDILLQDHKPRIADLEKEVFA